MSRARSRPSIAASVSRQLRARNRAVGSSAACANRVRGPPSASPARPFRPSSAYGLEQAPPPASNRLPRRIYVAASSATLAGVWCQQPPARRPHKHAPTTEQSRQNAERRQMIRPLRLQRRPQILLDSVSMSGRGLPRLDPLLSLATAPAERPSEARPCSMLALGRGRGPEAAGRSPFSERWL